MARVTITCDDCGRRHRLERPVNSAGMIWIVCHDCELPLYAMFDLPSTIAGAVAARQPAYPQPTAPEPAVPSQSFLAAWDGMLDLSSGGG